MGNGDKNAKSTVSLKIERVISFIHQSFMQPRKLDNGVSIRKQYWIETWSKIKQLTPEELAELKDGLETTIGTLQRLGDKIDKLRSNKLKESVERHSLEGLNHWEADEFLDSSANLPVFKTKINKSKGRHWIIAKPHDKPKNSIEICQCIWIIITNRSIHIVDGGLKRNVSPSISRDNNIEKQRLEAIPAILDDKTVTDVVTGKPLRNLYSITKEVKETLMWLMAEKAKTDLKWAQSNNFGLE